MNKWIAATALLLLNLLPGMQSPILALGVQLADTQTKAMKDALGTLLPLVVFVDAGWQFCSEQAPQEKEKLADAIRNWRIVNGAAVVDDLITATSRQNSSLAALYQKEWTALVLKLHNKVGDKADAWCRKFPQTLASSKWQLASRHTEQITLLGQLTKKIGEEASLPPGRRLPHLPISTFSQLKQAGVSPDTQLIPDAFHCYREKPGTSHLWPDMIIQVPGHGEYRSSFGSGRYRIQRKRSSASIQWNSGPFEGKESMLHYDRFGQRFRLNTRIHGQYYKFHCFQRGASDRYAQDSFRLRHPQPGDYQCRDLESGKQQALKLSTGGYDFGGSHGSYRVEDIIGRPGESSSRIIWTSGPLAGEGNNKTARYEEEEGTGLRRLTFKTTKSRFVMGTGGSSSELSAVCTAKGKPVVFQKYGLNKAPAPPKNAGGLEGFYYTIEDRFSHWSQESADAPHYYTFFPSGYVYEGEPDTEPEETDCSRTLPNGSPLCSLYFIKQDQIHIDKKNPLSFKKVGKKLQIGEKFYQPVPRSTLTKLQGRFFHSSFSKWGTMDWGGSNYSKTVFIFSSDGRFSQQKAGQNTHAFDAGPTGMDISGASIYGIGNSHDHNSGRYTIKGHTITFHYNDGREIHRFIWIKDNSVFYMMNKAFIRLTEKGE